MRSPMPPPSTCKSCSRKTRSMSPFGRRGRCARATTSRALCASPPRGVAPASASSSRRAPASPSCSRAEVSNLQAVLDVAAGVGDGQPHDEDLQTIDDIDAETSPNDRRSGHCGANCKAVGRVGDQPYAALVVATWELCRITTTSACPAPAATPAGAALIIASAPDGRKPYASGRAGPLALKR